jgi:hypothetical protein
MEKVIKDGKVAVLISSGFGAGWYTWNRENQELLFHPKLVEMVSQGKAKKIDDEWMKEHLGIEDVYCGGAANLRVHWLPVGTQFTVDEYDGSESIVTIDDLNIIA